ncbi:MAG: Ig-like domain-containing protein [Myxococcota bacterium]
MKAYGLATSRRFGPLRRLAALRAIARAGLLLLAFVAPAGLLAVAPLEAARAATQVTVTGPDNRGPQTPDGQGRFRFDGLQLRANAQNTFTVVATDDAGRRVEKQINITQLSLQSIVVASVKATPLPPERVIQLVEDGVIDLADPENFNVSTFQIVLTIGQEQIPVEVPIATGVVEELGSEEVPPLSDPGSGGGSSPKVPDTEIIVFDQVVECSACFEPPRIPGVIIIEGNIRSLKEFFSVRLLLMNMSGLFTLSNVRASLEFPEGGLSNTLPADGVVVFDEIGPADGDVPGQKEREFIVRGDEIGVRPIRVNFGGFVTGPGIEGDDAVPFSGSADTKVEVKGPPEFLVRVSHPDRVDALVPYELRVEITNAGDAPALYASLDLDVGADADLVECEAPASAGETPVCEPIEGAVVRQLQHLYPGDRVTESFTVLPYATGDISSCIGVSSQNIQLQVLVGAIGCLTGKLPTTRGVPTGVPTVSVIPYPSALGVGTDSPIVAFFSEPMNQGSISLGESGTFRVYAPDGQIAPGQLRFSLVSGKTVAIWQALDGITNRLAGNARYRVVLTQGIRDLQNQSLFAEWSSSFDTTSSTDDQTPPQLTLGIEPGVDPLRVLPGQLVQINAYAADQGTGVARVELRLQDANTPDVPAVFIDQKTRFGADAGPTLFGIDSGKLVPGHTYQARATAIDGAGNTQDATIPFVLAASVQAPRITLPADPASAVLQGVSVDVTPDSVSTTATSVAYYLDGRPTAFATQTLAPFQTRVATLELPLGTHVVRAVVTDALGQTGEDTLQFVLVENPNEPIVTFAGASDGVRILQGASLFVSGSASDPLGIASLRFALDDPAGAPLPTAGGSVQIETAALAVGAHRLYLIATNPLGVSNDPGKPDSSLDFVVQAGANGPAPAAAVLDAIAPPVGGRATVTGQAIAGATVTVRNLRSGIALSVVVGGDGRFSASLEAQPGDTIEAIVIDLARSRDASPAATRTVPAERVLTRLELSPASFSLVGQNATRDLSVTGFYSDGGSADLTAGATYRSSAPNIASVSASGRVVANARGVATITASIGSIEDTSTATVDIRTLESITVEPASVLLTAIGETRALSVVGHFSDATTEIVTARATFASSAPAVVGVAGGVAQALANGTAVITVSVSGLAPVAVPVEVAVAQDVPPTVEFLAAPADTVERGQQVGVTVRARDFVGVRRVFFTVGGGTSYAESRLISPTATTTDQAFSFTVSASAPLGGTLTVSLQAEDTGGLLSPIVSRTLTVVDQTLPSVSITAPAIDAVYGYADEVEVVVSATDVGGVAELRYVVDGIASANGSRTIAPPLSVAGATFRFRIPVGLVASNVTIRAFARDVAGNEGSSAPVPITIDDADKTPPETVATSASAPAGATTTVQYAVTSGLADLDHVELYFRRNGLGTFSRYTGPLGTGTGEFVPQSGGFGSIVFDATRMGGDGSFEFFTLGVDATGNREAPPRNLGAIVGDAGATATIATGAPVTVIVAPTELADASLDGRSLRIVGTTVTLVGTHAFANVELLGGAVLTHRETTQTEAFGLDFSAWTVSIDATSRIDVVARGYLGGNRSGLGETAHTEGFAPGAQNGTGGSHGGLGGDYVGNGGSVPNPIYGDLVDPRALGSGGGAWSGAGGDGGGLVRIGAINLVVDGSVRADGGLSAGSASGEGSGGSINLTLRTLAGLGRISADGGTTNGSNHTGGGGGRIAIRSLDRETYDAARLTARGGDGFYGDGADGTIYLVGEGAASGELVINGVGAGSPATDLVLPPGQAFSSITLQNGANVVARGAIQLSGTLLLRGNSRLAHETANEAGLSIAAREVVIEIGSAIDVSDRGYLGGNRTGLGETAHTLGRLPGSQNGTGGSHGGLGGDYSGNGSSVPTSVYGDPKRPNRLGAGGGAWGGAGANGGGLVRIVASDRVVVDGAILANGGVSAGSASGEGAGGSIWIETQRLAGTGRIAADGGTTGGLNHTAGGGGRVALYAAFVDPNADLGGLLDVTARGGDGFYGDGAAGTVYLKLETATGGTLFVDGVMLAGQTAPLATQLPPIGPGIAASVGADTLVVDGKLPAFTPDALVGLRLNPNRAQAQDFAIASNTSNEIRVVTPNENGVSFASVAAVGATYAGAWHFDELRLRRGGFLELADPLFASVELGLTENSVLTHPETTEVYAPDLVIEAGRVAVDATSRIDVTGRGYLGGNRSGLGETAHTEGFAAGAQNGTGGSHGGVGGDYVGNGASVPNAVYGNPTAPRALGAGGGAWGGAGGDGGGRIAIVANELVVDGALRADGGVSAGSASGEGAGGSIDLRIDRLLGTGLVSASGGTTNGANHTGGGGGRIAIRHGGVFGLPLGNVRAVGGDGFYGDGGHGSVYLLAPGQTRGDLVFDGFGFFSPSDSVVIPDGLIADQILLRNGVRAVATRITADTLRLEAGATLTHAARSEAGLTLDVRDLVVGAGAEIDVTGRGYLGGGKGPLGSTAETLRFGAGAGSGTGGSHGGLGGTYASNGGATPSSLYGDLLRPATLGGGGGAWGGTGGDGGGVIRIRATGNVDVDGAIRADGAISAGSASGEGAGGSIWIDAARVGGDGTISANGGNLNGVNHTGGGGGRVAIYAASVDTSADLLAARRATAYGGDGFYGDGAPGTVYLEIGTTARLVFDAGRAGGTWLAEASLPQVGPGVAAAVGVDSLTLDGRLPAPGVFVDHLAGVRINPNTAQGESFRIVSNTATTVFVETPNENGVAFASVAQSGAPYAASWRFPNVLLRGGVRVALADPIAVTGTLSVTEGSVLTHPETTGSYAGALDVEAGTLSVDATSTLDVDARGHLGGSRGAFGSTGETIGFTAGAGTGSGGSYGGLGGDYVGNGSAVPNPVYGDPNEPFDVGSGGGALAGVGGDGGGRIRLNVGALVLDGAIRANGGQSGGSASGDGSGGAINLRIGSLSGTGPITADGGGSGGANHTGGGGGRIAIRYGTGLVPLPNLVRAAGGDGFYGDGQPGSIVVIGP